VVGPEGHERKAGSSGEEGYSDDVVAIAGSHTRLDERERGAVASACGGRRGRAARGGWGATCCA
jgi:hypothetical protein